MSLQEKMWDLTELPQNKKDPYIRGPSLSFSFTKEDSESIYEGLFSGENSKRAQKIFLRLIVGMFEDDQEKEELLDEFEELTEEAVARHLRTRDED